MIVDDLGCTYRNLIANENYKEILEKFGFSRYYKKDVMKQNNGLDLRTKRTACISAYTKTGYCIVKNNTRNNLQHIDHFNYKKFIPEQRNFIKEINEVFKKITLKKNNQNFKKNFVDACIYLFKGYTSHDPKNNFFNNQKKILDCFSKTSQLLNDKSKF